MYTISKIFEFSASHQLGGLPEKHPCARLHGHNYRVRVEVKGELDGVGFVFDYNDLAPLGAWLKEKLDHRHLNDVLGFNPTAENMACYLFGVAEALHIPVTAVAVSETARTWAEYRP
jgi:6-pyruvoyltetrahydropterin/6-carboxytetrahydropterin synthase